MKRTFACAITVMAAVLILTLPVRGIDRYWDHDPATPADWFDPTNWNPDGLPGSADYEYIDNGGTATITVGDATIHGLTVGDYDFSENIVQTGGSLTTTSGVILGMYSGSTGTYQLGGTGQLIAPSLSIGRATSAAGVGVMTQTGGLNQVGNLVVGLQGTYTISGGTLALSGNLQISGVLKFLTGPWTLNMQTGWADFSNATFADASQATFISGANTLTAFHAGFDPAKAFGTFNPSGRVYIQGTTFVVEPGDNLVTSQDFTFTGPVDNRGGVLKANGVTNLVLNGLTISNGGVVDIGDGYTSGLFVQGGSLSSIAASGGQLIGHRDNSGVNLTVGNNGTGTFDQAGGTVGMNWLSIGNGGSLGTYYLSGTGALNTYSTIVGYSGPGWFEQSGGTHTTQIMEIGSSTGGEGTYVLSGTGVLNSGLTRLGASYGSNVGTSGTFNQLGGTHKTTKLYIGYGGEMPSEYNLSDGALNTDQSYVGYYQSGTFTQDGGTHTVKNQLYVSYESGHSGSYTLKRGLLQTGASYVGEYGPGTFLQEGGTHITSGSLTIADYEPSGYELQSGILSVLKNVYLGNHGIGTFTQSGGSATCGSLYVGDRSGSVGSYVHSGGTNSVTGDIYLGYGSNSQGTYQLDSAATLSANNIYVGYNSSATGTFINNGGTYHGNLIMGKNGTYTQGSGSITGTTVSLGSDGQSTITLNGGTGDFGTLNVGVNSSGTGSFNVNNTAQFSADNATIGNGGAGNMQMSGGMLTIHNNLVIGGTSGGQLFGGLAVIHSGIIVVGQVNQGLFSTDGGEIQSTILSLGAETGSLGAFTITNTLVKVGDFYVGGNGQATFNIMNSGANVQVSNSLRFGSQSTFSAVHGSAIHMTGAAFENQNTDPTKLAGLANVTLLYDGHTGVTDPFELAGKDYGRDLDGLVNNFVLGGMTLEDKAVVQLVDSFDNAHRNGVGGSAEAMYLSSLTMLPGSTLDLNGKHLYVGDLDYQGGSIINGTLISMVRGDADNNFAVDGADLAVWQQHYDPAGVNAATNSFATGDWNNDGAVDGADLALWQQNYNPTGGLPQQTPEPGTMLLLGSGLMLFFNRKGRKERKEKRNPGAYSNN